MKLSDNSIAILRLIERSNSDEHGWCTVSNMVFPLLSNIPSELIETKEDDRKFVRLTEQGKIVLKYL